MSAGRKLSNMQLELLKIFSMDLSEEQLLEVKQLLTGYFAKNISSDVEKLFAEKNGARRKLKNGIKNTCAEVNKFNKSL